MPREAVGPWPSPAHGSGPAHPGSLPEGETEAMSNAQRSTLKWEKEETLGELATVAPVLYTNVNFPNLKEEYPGLYMTQMSFTVLFVHHFRHVLFVNRDNLLFDDVTLERHKAWLIFLQQTHRLHPLLKISTPQCFRYL